MKLKLLQFLIILSAIWLYSGFANAATLSAPPPSTGLVGYWSFNEGTSTEAGDFSGKGNHGKLVNGPVWAEGRRGKALNFDGSNDVVDTGSGASLDQLPALSVSAWIYPKSGGEGGFGRIVEKASGLGSTAVGWYFIINNTNAMNFTVDYDTTNPERTTGSTFKFSQWSHVVVTWDGSTTGSNIKMYVNGLEATYSSTVNGAGNRVDDSANNLRIGNDASGARTFDGLIDEVRVYNRELSAAEVKALYQSGAARISAPSNTGLVGYWSFNEGTSTEAGDASGKGNHGKLVNFPANPAAPSGWTSAGRRGGALSFDGSDDFVSIANEANFDFERTSSFSISAWVFLKVNAAGGIVTKMEPDTNFKGWNTFQRGGTSNPTFAFEIRNVTGNRAAAYTTTEWPLNKWYHIVWTYNGTSAVSGEKIYVDSVNQALTTLEDTLSATILQNISPQINGRGGATFLRANYIDEVRVYNRALSSDEVKALYRSGAARINSSQSDRLRKGLVGYWSFDGSWFMRGKALDASGLGNDAIATQTPAVAGKVGQALSFNGVNNYVEVGSPASLDDIAVKTVSMWVKRRINTKTQLLIGKGGAGTGGNGWDIEIRRSTGGAGPNTVRYLHMWSTSAGGSAIWYSSTTLTDNSAWYHVVVIYDSTSSANDPQIWVNGQQETITESQAPSGTEGTDAANNLHIGSGESATSNPHDSLIDEFRIYNRALSAEEVKRLYNIGR